MVVNGYFPKKKSNAAGAAGIFVVVSVSVLVSAVVGVTIFLIC